MFQVIPWDFSIDQTHFWIHYGLCIVGLLLSIISYITQLSKPAPYGRHATTDANWGPLINQRIAHTLSDGPTGVIIFSLVFFLYGSQRDYVNIIFYTLWVFHYVHRGFIHPWIMNYSSPTTPIGIPVAGLFPNLLFCFLNADWLGAATYPSNYYFDPRFIVGIVLFVSGFIINRTADYTLKNLRRNQTSNKDDANDENNTLESKGTDKYFIPQGFLFNVISCPNYFGEMVEWFGWAIATWSIAGLVWFLFGCATFVPRAKQHHNWYNQKFDDYPSHRKSLIPFLF